MRSSTTTSVSVALFVAFLSKRIVAVPVPLDLGATLNSLTGSGGDATDPNAVSSSDVTAVVSAATDLLGGENPTFVDAALAVSLCQAVNSLSDLLGLGQTILACDNLPPAAVQPASTNSCDFGVQAVQPEDGDDTWEEPESTWSPDSESTWTPEAESTEEEWAPEPTQDCEEPPTPVVDAAQPPPTTTILVNPACSGLVDCLIDTVDGVADDTIDTVNGVLDTDSVLHLGLDSVTDSTSGLIGGGLLGGAGTSGGPVGSLVHVAAGAAGGSLLGSSNSTPVIGVLNAVSGGEDNSQPDVQPFHAAAPEAQPSTLPAPIDSRPVESYAVPASAPASNTGLDLLGVTNVAGSLLHAGVL
ncbi:hypothetical protein BKA62DRAFT_833615 [Auriculariales sp. MPI-PUGE-AT-0066]|nr:hypothetical protein BKA62DRAFT_833615 [Auriculariales sp. MPI-PUGE-AT-0066]